MVLDFRELYVVRERLSLIGILDLLMWVDFNVASGCDGHLALGAEGFAFIRAVRYIADV